MRVVPAAAMVFVLAGCGTTDDLAGVVRGAAGAGTPGTAGSPSGGAGDAAGASAGGGPGGSSGSGGSGGEPLHPGVYAGFRASRYGIEPFPTPEYWADAAVSYASALGAAPGGVWIVGVIRAPSTCFVNFPSPDSPDPHVEFGDTDENEAYLSHFDAMGMKVWLQVEPADANVETLIDLVLDRYGSHPSVIGFGVDAEWYQESSHDAGAAVTDAEAAAWRARVQSHDPSYTLFLKHWLIDHMPPTERAGLVFIDDSQSVASMDALVDEFAIWGETFSPRPVGFQLGYPSDRGWWSGLGDPPGDLGRALLDRVPNTVGVFWVDFTIREVF
jgi:hypothetical protein